MKPLLGYLAHRASVRLHWLAVDLLPDAIDDDHSLFTMGPVIERYLTAEDGDPQPLSLPDVVPRLAAGICWARDRLQHASWLAAHMAHARSRR